MDLHLYQQTPRVDEQVPKCIPYWSMDQVQDSQRASYLATPKLGNSTVQVRCPPARSDETAYGCYNSNCYLHVKTEGMSKMIGAVLNVVAMANAREIRPVFQAIPLTI